MLRDNQVIIRFASNISGEAQAKAIVKLEKHMRTLTNQEIEVFKEVGEIVTEAANGC